MASIWPRSNDTCEYDAAVDSELVGRDVTPGKPEDSVSGASEPDSACPPDAGRRPGDHDQAVLRAHRRRAFPVSDRSSARVMEMVAGTYAFGTDRFIQIRNCFGRSLTSAASPGTTRATRI